MQKRKETVISEWNADKKELTLTLGGEIDHHTAGALRQQCDEEISVHKPEILLMNLRNVSFMDSSGLGLVLGRLETLHRVGGKHLAVTEANEGIRRIFRLANLSRFVKIEEEKRKV